MLSTTIGDKRKLRAVGEAIQSILGIEQLQARCDEARKVFNDQWRINHEATSKTKHTREEYEGAVRRKQEVDADAMMARMLLQEPTTKTLEEIDELAETLSKSKDESRNLMQRIHALQGPYEGERRGEERRGR
jgi:hypothetical protein